jgi:hypothetical protein
MCQCILNAVYRIGLRGGVEGKSPEHISEWDEKRTWMLSWSDLQDLTVTMSGRPGTRMVERDIPANMREMGDSAELA